MTETHPASKSILQNASLIDWWQNISSQVQREQCASWWRTSRTSLRRMPACRFNFGLAVVRVGTGKDRTLTKKFKELKGFYAFESNFCTPGIEGAHEKGGVEGGIGYSRRNWLVPVPKVASVEELNTMLLKRGVKDGDRVVDGQQERITEAFSREKVHLLALPERRFDPGTARSNVIADSYQTVIYDSNRYSVPHKYVGRPLRVRAYLDRLVFAVASEVVAEHEWSYDKDCYCLKPEHYLEQLERKPHAVPYARPLLQTKWPDGYWSFYKRLVEQKGPSDGGKDFVRVLRCHMQHGATLTAQAIHDCVAVGLISADAILQVVAQARFSTRVTVIPLDMAEHPTLKDYSVRLEETDRYQILIGEQANEHGFAGAVLEAAAVAHRGQELRVGGKGS